MKTLLACLLLLTSLPAMAQRERLPRLPRNNTIAPVEVIDNNTTENENELFVQPPQFIINPPQVIYQCVPEVFGESAGVPLYEWSESKSFYFFESKMAIDADGSPRAYHPQDKGLDKLEYAGREGNWWALVTHNGLASGEPVIQKEGDPYPGYYISTTAVVNRGYPDGVPERYLDAEKIPYFVLNPTVMYLGNTKKGDIGYVYNRKTKKGCYAIFGDVGSPEKIGEGSIYLAKQLGINADPRTGGQAADVVYMVFPFSGNGAGKTLAEINAIGEKLMQKADGFTFIKTCLEGKK